MQRALELALRGRGYVSTNPLVGCVLVREDRIIGEGWHKRFGGPHAEVEAVRSVEDTSLLAGCTAYVTLEPCAHHGKTPPCTELLLESGVARVVIATPDPFPEVAGKGIQRLQDAGLEVIIGVGEAEAREQNIRFFTFVEKRRPYIVLKWAQTLDGFIARSTFESKWISHEPARQLVHKWRAEEDAVLVGTRTAAHDNPQLNVRSWSGRNPTRIVIDRFLRLAPHLHLFDGTQTTLCYNVLVHDEQREKCRYIRLPESPFLPALIQDLYARHLQSVLVEGGAHTLAQFIAGGWWDEARVFTAPRTFGEGIAAPALRGEPIQGTLAGPDQLWVYRPKARPG